MSTVNIFLKTSCMIRSNLFRLPTYYVAHRRQCLKTKASDLGILATEKMADIVHGLEFHTKRALEESDILIYEILSSEASERTVLAFDDLSNVLCQVADLAACLRILHPNQQVQEGAGKCCAQLQTFTDSLNVHKGLYNALNGLISRAEVFNKLDDLTRRMAGAFLHDFKINGIHLSNNGRAKTIELHKTISESGHIFMSGASSPVYLPIRDCPGQLSARLPTIESYKVLYSEVDLSNDPDEAIRRLAYTLYNAPHSSLMESLETLIRSRHSLARMVGYTSYAHLQGSTTMLKDPYKVLQFLEELSLLNMPKAVAHVRKLANIKQTLSQEVQSTSVYPWDIGYLTRKAVFEDDHTNPVCPRFLLDTCMDGLNQLFHSLFGVTLQEETAASADNLWHQDVKKIKVIHDREGTLGYILCDLQDRPGKMIENCHFTLRGGKALGGEEYQKPVIAVSCGFSSTSLSLSEVSSLFHEMGHALHSILGRTLYQHVTGTRCSLDFAEIPSSLNELFLTHPKVLATIARNPSNGLAISDNDIHRIIMRQKFGTSYNLQFQILLSVFDLKLHLGLKSGATPLTLWEEVSKQHSPLPFVPNTAWFLHFGHLNMYGGLYFSYIWAQAVAKIMWEKCFQNEPFSCEMGHQYGLKVLACGGEKPSGELIRNFLGFEPSIKDLVEVITES